MRSRVLISAFALALTGAVTSCDEDITSVGEGLDETATWRADMDASQETTAPNLAGASNPFGRAWFIDNGNEITFFIEWSGMSTPVVGGGGGAHIHRAAVGQAGNVIVGLPVVQRTSGTVAGFIDMTVADVGAGTENVSPDSLRTLLNNGNAYVNIHTTQNPGGEIRGQIRRN